MDPKRRPTLASFELCEVCNINHDRGRRHRYQSSHRRALSGVLSRFQSKLTELRFFLRHPSPLRPDHSALNRLWCVFCSLDITELASPFACSNAIHHLAGADHLNNIKEFMRKHGGGATDHRIDSFRISEADLIKWEKGCEALKSADPAMPLRGEGVIGPQMEPPSKDIRNETRSNHADSFGKCYISSFISSSSVPNDVMPLQRLTYEDQRMCRTGPAMYGSGSQLVAAMRESVGHQYMHPEAAAGGQPMHMGNSGKRLIDPSIRNRTDHWSASSEDSTTVLQSLTRISSTSEVCTASVHTSALPPWLDTCQENDKDLLVNGLDTSNRATPIVKTGKSRKLNPKRVGAAWAEKRRIELEMEKRGELIANSSDADWLPNFGRVWQTGTRKESRKEFEKEKQKFLKDENTSEPSFKMQPYISKRMRVSSSKNYVVNPHVEDLSSNI